jgi:hypothetical protein
MKSPRRPCTTDDGRSASVGGEVVGWMAGVAAAVLPAYIGDGGVGPLGLDLERRDQCILRLDGDAVRFALGRQAYREM